MRGHSIRVALALLGLGEANYPLSPPQTPEKCLCQNDLGVYGWSSRQNRCMTSSVTTCLECPFQEKCAHVHTLAGDGVEIFWGDCRSSTQACTPAAQSSFSFAVSIAVDEENNVYFSDQGNNRIRMLDAKLDALVTIAGTGEVGFSGDGGPARLAQLRQPEGLALKPKTNEVYFADFLNQRIRKLVRGAEWFIYTVAGTGVMAEDSCDSGCVALEASLWNPRALAFASNQDLYIVEAGSRKILKLTTSLGDPSQNPTATLYTFAGSRSQQQGMWQAFRGIARSALPGNFKVPNSALQLSELYAIAIDRHDRLWAVDSDNNRIFMLPLINISLTLLKGDFGNFLERFEMSTFEDNSTAEERQAARPGQAEALKTWLALEFPAVNATFDVESSQIYEQGYSYWKYAAPVAHQTWCPARNIQSLQGCDVVTAQSAKFGSIMGLCIDPAENMYLIDNEDSQIVYLEDKPRFLRGQDQPAAERVTESGCPCERYWVEDTRKANGEFHLPGVERFAPEDLISRRTCRENPQSPFILALAGRPGDLNLLPQCSTTEYCSEDDGLAPDYPHWCFVNARDLPDGSFKSLCGDRMWSFCSSDVQEWEPAEWQFLPNAAILGNEKRFETLYQYGEDGFNNLVTQLSEDLWVQQNTPYHYSMDNARERTAGFFLEGTAILKGFVDTGSGQARCGDYCCGLPKLRSFLSDLGASGYVCGLQSVSNLTVMQGYFQGPTGPGGGPPVPVTVLTVFEELESLVAGVEPEVDSVSFDKIDLCKSRCLYDQTCTGFMVKGASSSNPQLLSNGQPCIFYSQSQPFYVYTIDRTVAPFSQRQVDLSVEVDRAKALNLFVGPGVPASRLAGDPDGIYVSQSIVGSKDTISGPHLEKGLDLMGCQELCLRDVLCTGIAFPGCYLLKKEVIKMLPAGSTSLIIKELAQPQVKAVVGYSKAEAFNDQTARVTFSYLSNPLSCTVDAKGDLIYSDGSNHRIRKITSFTTSCSVSGLFSQQQVEDYESTLANVDSACNNVSVQELRTHYANSQQAVLENNSLEMVQQYFCNNGASAHAAVMEQQYTNNLFVLCRACESLTPRPSACPWLELCECRDAMAQAVLNPIHVGCPQRNAHVDPWHRWLTAFTSCWMQDATAANWTTGTQQTDLQQQLQSL